MPHRGMEGERMSEEQRYIIKFLRKMGRLGGGGVTIPSAYWYAEGREWVEDPMMANQFHRSEGINEAGRLLVESDWITELVPVGDVKREREKRVKNPFVVSPDGSRWCVSLENPSNPDDFVVVYRSWSEDDCGRVCEVLNGLFEENLRVRSER